MAPSTYYGSNYYGFRWGGKFSDQLVAYTPELEWPPPMSMNNWATLAPMQA